MKAHLLALATIFVWGTTFVSTKVLLADLAPQWILLIRFALGLVALCALRPRVLHVASRRDEGLFALAGLTGVAAYYLLENMALTFASATAVGVIVTTSPLITALIAAARGQRETLSPRFLAGFALAMAGVLLVSLAGSASEGAVAGAEAGAGAADAGPVTSFADAPGALWTRGTTAPGAAAAALDAGALVGCALALAAAAVWAAYSLLVARLAAGGYETIAATKRTFAWGLLLMTPAVLLGGDAPQPASLVEPVNAANLLFLGLIASAACFVTWGYAVKHLGAVVTSTYIYLVPAVTAACAAVVLGEPLSPAVLAGMALTVAGLLLSRDRRSRPPHGKCRESGQK